MDTTRARRYLLSSDQRGTPAPEPFPEPPYDLRPIMERMRAFTRAVADLQIDFFKAAHEDPRA